MSAMLYLCTGLNPLCRNSDQNVCFRDPKNKNCSPREVCRYTSDLEYALRTAMSAQDIKLNTHMVKSKYHPDLLIETITTDDLDTNHQESEAV